MDVDETSDGGDGAPEVPNPQIGIPSVPQSGPAVPESLPSNAPAIQALQARLAGLQNPQPAAQPSRLVQALKFLVPLLGASVAAGRGMGAEGWAQGTQRAEDAQAAKQRAAAQQADQSAQEQERLSLAIKNLQNEDNVRRAQAIAQKKIDAQTAEAGIKARHAGLQTTFKSLADGGLIDTLNNMVDQGQDVNAYLDRSSVGGQPLREIVNSSAVLDPDGKHYLGGKTKTFKEAALGSKEDVVGQALAAAVRANNGLPISDDLRQKVTLQAVHDYDQLPKDPTMQAIALAMKNTQEGILKLREQELENNMTPLMRATKRLGPEASRIGDLDTGLQEAERLQTLLKVHGLDQDNNPIGPRLATLAARQGVNIGDLPADIAQGAAFTKAKLFSVLGRGNSGRSMAMYNALGAHLPDSIQTGKQLSDVLKSVTREYQESRHNALRVKGVADEDLPFEHKTTNGKQYVGQKVVGGTVVGFDKDGNAMVDDGK